MELFKILAIVFLICSLQHALADEAPEPDSLQLKNDLQLSEQKDEKPIDVSLLYIGDPVYGLDGGSKDKLNYLGAIYLNFAINTEKLFGWTGK